MIDDVECEIANAKIQLRFFRIPSAQGIHTSHQLAHRKWLRQVIVGAKSQPSHTVFHFRSSGEHQHAAVYMLGTQMPQDVKPVHSRQSDIQHDQIEWYLLYFIQCLFTIMNE